MVDVLAAVIERAGRYLLCKRPSFKRHGGLWEFPGGKLERGESLDDAARRELAEELGIEVESVGELLASFRDPGSIYVIKFVSIAIRGEPQAHEHDEVVWATVQELENLELAPCDHRFVVEQLSTMGAKQPKRLPPWPL
jgi:mutator protein MutT